MMYELVCVFFLKQKTAYELRMSDRSSDVCSSDLVYLLDAYDNPVPAGVIGELCIGGRGVALGYLDRPELTAERVIDNPVPGAPAGTIYRSEESRVGQE